MSKIFFPKSVPISGRVRICLELLKLQRIEKMVVVDVGSSFGWLEKEILKLKPKTIVGVDPNADAVEFAKNDVPNAKFFVGEAQKLPLEDNFADVLCLFDVIEHVPKGLEKVVLKEVNRVLKKEGKLLLSTPNSHFIAKYLDLAWYFGHRHYTKSKIVKLLDKTGFKVESIRSRGNFFSSFYLFWFYIAKKITGKSQPRNYFLEKLDDLGYDSGEITDIFLTASKI